MRTRLYLAFAFLTLAVSINIDVSLQEIIMGAFTFVAAIGIVHKMKSTRNATVMTLIILGALLLKISDTTASVNCSAQRLQVAILLVPPLTLNNSHDDVKRGSLRDRVIQITENCINFKNHSNIKDRRNSKNHRNDLAMKLECFQVENFQEEQSFQEYILNNDIDIAFPISSRMKKTLSSENDNMSFHELIETPGYSLIMDTGHVNNKANTIAIKKLVQNAWPIVVLVFLFAGIAGICVWVLVSLFVNTLTLLLSTIDHRGLTLQNHSLHGPFNFKGIFRREWPYSIISTSWCDATVHSYHLEINQSIVILDKYPQQTNKKTCQIRVQT